MEHPLPLNQTPPLKPKSESRPLPAAGPKPLPQLALENPLAPGFYDHPKRPVLKTTIS